jgi:hypothetical protein
MVKKLGIKGIPTGQPSLREQQLRRQIKANDQMIGMCLKKVEALTAEDNLTAALHYSSRQERLEEKVAKMLKEIRRIRNMPEEGEGGDGWSHREWMKRNPFPPFCPDEEQPKIEREIGMSKWKWFEKHPEPPDPDVEEKGRLFRMQIQRDWEAEEQRERETAEQPSTAEEAGEGEEERVRQIVQRKREGVWKSGEHGKTTRRKLNL